MTAPRHPPMQPGWIDQPHRRLPLGDFRLESGEVIRDFELSYVLHGEISPSADNVVLLLSAISSTHHRLDFLIGEGRALSTQRYALLAVDAIGNGLSTSPSTSARQPGWRFPRFTIRDMVESQRCLLDHLGIDRLHAVIGASMGGMQALQWGVSHPRRMRHLVAMTPMARTSAWAVAINETSRRALEPFIGRGVADGDGLLAPGQADLAWRAWVPLMQLISGRTPAQVDRQFESPTAVLDWIEERTRWWAPQPLQPIDWWYQTLAYDAHDVGTTPGCDGDVARALARIEASTLVAAPALDLYNPAVAAREACRLIRDAQWLPLPGDWGHQSATAADEASASLLNREIAAWLDRDAR